MFKMEKIPLQARLKREIHRKIAFAQDMIVKEVYSVFNKPVLHGGTGIWRCFKGKRFSEDLDFYFPDNKEKIKILFEKLKKIGFEITKQRILKNSLYSELKINRVSVRLEAVFKNVDGILSDYELSDGNFISIYSLSAEQFLAEKANAYLKRLKIRDLWDVFFLLKFVEKPKEIKEIYELIKNYKKPVDEQDLKVILLEGIVPSSDDMIEYIKKKWENKFI
jgi:predicted nucleotidyltransferase component of viral defense system